LLGWGISPEIGKITAISESISPLDYLIGVTLANG
jgi:hypothetical protein